ncbi:hypothetical protein [Acinetobacter defluvii]|uniref:hypothetical protein n=1 Tax=Acinetobacter defluvii TaxID=1871111 RepID=UPI003AF573C9
MLGISIITLISSVLIFAFIFRHFQTSKQTHSGPLTICLQSPNTNDFLEFDREINKILNNPLLSNADKERLTNEYAEQYLLKNAMD